MRCPDCEKFVSYDEPTVETQSVDLNDPSGLAMRARINKRAYSFPSEPKKKKEGLAPHQLGLAAMASDDPTRPMLNSVRFFEYGCEVTDGRLLVRIPWDGTDGEHKPHGYIPTSLLDKCGSKSKPEFKVGKNHIVGKFIKEGVTQVLIQDRLKGDDKPLTTDEVFVQMKPTESSRRVVLAAGILKKIADYVCKYGLQGEGTGIYFEVPVNDGRTGVAFTFRNTMGNHAKGIAMPMRDGGGGGDVW